MDLRFDKSSPMDWKQYSSRLKDFGIAIPKGETVTVTTVVVKKDVIEFQLDGGGFGTFGDDTNTKVEAKPVEKSAYEKQLEQDIANTDDPDRKRDLQAIWTANATGGRAKTPRISGRPTWPAESRRSRFAGRQAR